MLSGSSEIQEAFRLLQGLVHGPSASAARGPVPGPAASPASPPRAAASRPSPFRQILAPAETAAVAVPPATGHRAPAAPTPLNISGATRADRLTFILDALCLRGGLAGAVLADESGFPLAEHGQSVTSENLAVFTSVLGEALQKAGRLLGHFAADYISMDVDYEHKLGLKRFVLSDRPYFLMVLGPQNVDERTELEVSIGQVVSVLSGS